MENQQTILPGDKFEIWGVLELMGHVKVAGRITEEDRFGGKLGRIDIPDAEQGFSTQYFGFSSVYRLTACTEEVARFVAGQNRSQPVHSWDLAKVRALNPGPTDIERDAVDGETDDEFD